MSLSPPVASDVDSAAAVGSSGSVSAKRSYESEEGAGAQQGAGKRSRGGRGESDGKQRGNGKSGRRGQRRQRGARRTRAGGEAEGEERSGEAAVNGDAAALEAVEEQAEGEEDNDADDGYTGPLPRSALFEAYYRLQDLVPSSEWEEWIGALQRKLPVTFRLSSINGLHRRLLACLQRDEFGIEQLRLTVDGRTLHAPQPLDWYPDSMAWYLPVSKGRTSANTATHRHSAARPTYSTAQPHSHSVD